MTVTENISAGVYETKLAYIRQSGNTDWLRERRKVYREDKQRLIEVFKTDLIEENGFTGHPKADALFYLAWGYGHASGFHEIESYFQEFMILVERQEIILPGINVTRTIGDEGVPSLNMTQLRNLLSIYFRDGNGNDADAFIKWVEGREDSPSLVSTPIKHGLNWADNQPCPRPYARPINERGEYDNRL